MRTVKALFAASLLAHGAAGRRLRKQKVEAKQSLMLDGAYPFYHSTDDIHTQLQELVTNCPGMTLETESGDGVDIDVVTIRAPGSTPTNKNFYLFGEHARELISPETGLNFVRTLCGQTAESAQAQEVLKDNEYQIIVNGNPRSRSKVETGDFCLRVNEHGVDLNRNWDEKWEAAPEFSPVDTNPGPAPFSEPETRIFKKLVMAYQPDTFLTIHSGTRGMYMPWAFDMQHLADRNQPQMMHILKSLDKKYCECPYGAAGKEVGYPCPGTCLDWVYEKLKTQYSFAFEIYIGEEYDMGLKERFESKIAADGGALIQLNSHLAHPHFHSLFAQNPSCFVQTKDSDKALARMMEDDANDCFGRFNPNTEELYKETINKWSSAFLDMSQMIASNMKTGNTNTTSSATF